MYVWSENVASRGEQEIGSCLKVHLRNHITDKTRNVILYSDSCSGQNRNIKLTVMLKHILATSNSIRQIEQKYFVSGHSFNSCDRSFALIERDKKLYEIISTPDDWIQIIRNSKKLEPKFSVTKMEMNNFFSSKQLQQLIDIGNTKINWLDIRSMKYDINSPFTIFIENDLKEKYTVNFKKIGVTENDFKNTVLSYLYPNGNKITKAKYDDLMVLMKYIDEQHRQFYQNLEYFNNNKDFGLASGVSNSESE